MAVYMTTIMAEAKVVLLCGYDVALRAAVKVTAAD